MALSKLSICCITYNHVSFISQAIESFLEQQTNFDFEIIIFDDASTDGTSELIRKFAQNNPQKVRYKINDKNIGMISNFINVLNASKSRYIALCEGDDYWTDPFKLQKQFDFLEQNPDYSICYHRVLELCENQMIPDELNSLNETATYTLMDLAKGNLMNTASVLFRNSYKNGIPDWFSLLPIGDYPIHILNALKGKIYYMPDFMAVYRHHSNSTWSNKKRNYRYDKKIDMLRVLLNNLSLPCEIKDIFQKRINEYTHFLLSNSLKYDSRNVFFKFFFKYLRVNSLITCRWIRTRIVFNFQNKNNFNII